jgi:glycosyltransferase involved in cell wall biosynthesis
MPEIAKDAALLVDPFSVDSISNAMVIIYNDEHVRTKLIENGRKRKLEFSWDKTANALWNSIEGAVNSQIT